MKRVRDIKCGDVLKFDDGSEHTVFNIEPLNGSDGSVPVLIGTVFKSAVALKITFGDGRSIVKHPTEQAPIARNSQTH